MGFRRWLRQFIVKVREVVGWEKDFGGRYDDLDCLATFEDGSSWRWQGRPWVCSFSNHIFFAFIELGQGSPR